MRVGSAFSGIGGLDLVSMDLEPGPHGGRITFAGKDTSPSSSIREVPTEGQS